MKISAGSVISAYEIFIEVEGALQNNVIELDTETGEARVYKMEGSLFVEDDGEYVIEDVTFPVDKLHVYLVKPK